MSREAFKPGIEFSKRCFDELKQLEAAQQGVTDVFEEAYRQNPNEGCYHDSHGRLQQALVTGYSYRLPGNDYREDVNMQFFPEDFGDQPDARFEVQMRTVYDSGETEEHDSLRLEQGVMSRAERAGDKKIFRAMSAAQQEWYRDLLELSYDYSLASPDNG